jgi:hypothetical protein
MQNSNKSRKSKVAYAQDDSYVNAPIIDGPLVLKQDSGKDSILVIDHDKSENDMKKNFKGQTTPTRNKSPSLGENAETLKPGSKDTTPKEESKSNEITKYETKDECFQIDPNEIIKNLKSKDVGTQFAFDTKSVEDEIKVVTSKF